MDLKKEKSKHKNCSQGVRKDAESKKEGNSGS